MSTEMRPEQGIAGKFVRSALDENGVLSKIEFTNSEKFNFAYDVMDALADKEPDQTALIYVSKDRTVEKKFTFQDIKDYSNRAANYFKSLGIKKGDKVMLVLKRHYQYWFTMMALHKIGAIAIPATNILKATDYQYRIEAAGVSAVVCTSDDGITASIDTFADDKLTKIVVNNPVEGWNFFDEGIMECSTEFPRPTGEDAVGGKDDILFVMFTSGTTSQSKGVVIKNYNIMNAVATYQKILNITADDISAIPIPIYHVTGMVALLGLFIHCGGTLYLHKIFNARRVLQCVKEHNITFLHASPTVFSMLLEEKDLFPSLPTLKQFACGSSNMPKEKLTAIHNWLPHSVFHTVYGLTETTSPATIFPGDASTSPYIGSSGFPVPGTVFEIRDDNGAPLKDGQIGEIWIHGNVVLTSYYKTDTPSLKDGWLGTGDLGYFNEKGYLFVVDRKKDMINRGGEKICSFDVENEIYKLKGVNEAAVVGIPDDVYGEVAAALVKLGPGSDLDEPKIQALLHKKIAKYKIPKRILITDEIPLTPNGKIDKRAIRKMF